LEGSRVVATWDHCQRADWAALNDQPLLPVGGTDLKTQRAANGF
jgi:hypothetical protein